MQLPNLLLSALMLLGAWTSVHGQETQKKEPPESNYSEMVKLSKESVNSDFTLYSFQSNKRFNEDQKERWEHRYKASFSEIHEISLNPLSQTVNVTLQKDHSTELLERILVRFNCLNYQIEEIK